MLNVARRAAQEGLGIIERVGAPAVSTPVSMKHGMLLVDLGHDELGLPKVRCMPARGVGAHVDRCSTLDLYDECDAVPYDDQSARRALSAGV